jgi:hypothetical protein
LNLIHVLGEIEDLRQKCENKFTCEGCPLKGDKEFCDAILSLPEKIADVLYGGNFRC